ncbi:preprotein translocase subunit SecG [Furfurilactobacillus curtus]|uniref:Protein-export membrane protein SecG n=1 Tax=Furfurilactobacillus curtus TaxID=1746200 RepID=A0ABQ5JQZ2_9LACO
MYNFLLTALIVIAIVIVIAVMLQPTKTDDALGALSGGGGANDLFAQQKSRGFEGFMQRVTVVLGILFFGIALALVYLSSH